MIRNYLLTALRNLATHKLFAFINIGGLAVGLTCAVFIMLFVRDELSYDRWIPDSSDLYQVRVTFNAPGRAPLVLPSAPFPMPAAMADQIPEVRAMTRLMTQEETVALGDRQFTETIDVVDPQFFQVIKLPLVEGDPANVFAHPESAVISQSLARKYFGREAGVVGKTLSINGGFCPPAATACEVQSHTVLVTGILRDLPHNTQLAADILIPNTSSADLLSREMKDSWTSASGASVVLLASGADPSVVLAKLNAIIDRSVPKQLAAAMGQKSGSAFLIPRLTRFWDGHLSADPRGGMTPPGSRTTVYGFAVIGTLILLVACFNFTNLAIARATLRAREISLRKVMGARRGQIVVQFLGEAVLMAFASLLLTLAAIQPLLPVFDRFLDKPLAFQYLSDWPLTLGIVMVAIVAGLLSGLYPAVVLSKFKPAATLRTSAVQVTGSAWFRTALVVVQFAVSIGLGIAAIVVFAQISHARHSNLGFQKDGVVVIGRGETMSPSSRQSFADALRAQPGITDVAISTEVPILSDPVGSNSLAVIPGHPSTELFKTVLIGPEFMALYHVRLLAGRPLSADRGEDALRTVHSRLGGQDIQTPAPGSSFNILINASAARRLGYTAQQAVGKTFGLYGAYGGTATVVGVIDDIKMSGPKFQPSATVFFDVPQELSSFSVRVRPEHLTDTLSVIDKTWAAFAPGYAISRFFLNDKFEKVLEADDRQGKVFTLFVGIAIFIACLGLFGLAAFTAQRRTKEIGVRKTFGAKTRHIVLLLLWQFSIPVLLANLIAWPFAYYYLHGWLESYVDRIAINPLFFIGSGAAALIIAWATVFAHTYRIARANPINALRYE